jgi:hypothetical protein
LGIVGFGLFSVADLAGVGWVNGISLPTANPTPVRDSKNQLFQVSVGPKHQLGVGIEYFAHP